MNIQMFYLMFVGTLIIIAIAFAIKQYYKGTITTLNIQVHCQMEQIARLEKEYKEASTQKQAIKEELQIFKQQSKHEKQTLYAEIQELSHRLLAKDSPPEPSSIKNDYQASINQLSSNNQNPLDPRGVLALSKSQIQSYHQSIAQHALERYQNNPPTLLAVSATYKSSSSAQTYTTTLSTCTCKHQKYSSLPCKHMVGLALNLGVLRLNHPSATSVEKK